MSGDVQQETLEFPASPKFTAHEDPTTDERAAAWIAQNSLIVGEVVRKAKQIVELGGSHVSVKEVVASIQIDRQERGVPRIDWNNNYSPMLAAWIVERHPVLDGPIRLKRTKAAA